MDVHAHGASADFGSIDENRRVGIRIREAPDFLPSMGPGLLGDDRLHLDAMFQGPSLFPTPDASASDAPVAEGEAAPPVPAPSPWNNPFLWPGRLPPWREPPAPGPLSSSPPPIDSREGVDWGALARSAGSRGQSVDGRDADAADAMNQHLFLGWRPIVGPWLADIIAGRSVSGAYEQFMAREHGTMWDVWQREDAERGTSPHSLSIDLLNPPWADRKKKKP
jgi:hypothetical protein